MGAAVRKIMSFDPSWRPMEDEATLFSERTWLAGMILTGVGYGMVFTLFFLSFTKLIRTTTRYNYHARLPFLIYISVMLIFATLYLGSIAKMTQLSFIDYRMYPGGPAAFETDQYSIPIDAISNVCYVLANWLADGMVIYRYKVIYETYQQIPHWIVMSIPIIAYLASISFGVVWIIQVTSPSSSPWRTDTTVNFTAPYFWMSLSFNIFMTIAICARLLFHRWKVTTALGSQHGTQYTSVVSIIVESSFLYSAFALLFLIPFALNNPIQNAFLQLLGEVQIVASLLITYRVAYDDAWVNEHSRHISTRETRSGVQPEFLTPQTRSDSPPDILGCEA